MKKHILFALFVIVGSISGYSQFNENGYKQLQLGMTHSEAKKIVSLKSGDDYPTVTFDGLKFDLSFLELEKLSLYSIKTSSPNAKIEGVRENLIGKKYKEIKAILGDKLEAFFDDSDGFTKYQIYYRNEQAKTNYMTSCVLEFDDNGVLESIFAAYNP